LDAIAGLGFSAALFQAVSFRPSEATELDAQPSKGAKGNVQDASRTTGLGALINRFSLRVFLIRGDS